MSVYDQLSSAAAAELEALEYALPSKIESIDSKLSQVHSVSLDEMTSTFRAAIDPKKPTANATIAELLPFVRTATCTCVLDMKKIERWIVLSIPKIEDGNNFGVAIQMDVNKLVGERLKEVKALFDKAGEYHKERAAAWKEVATKVSTDTSEGSSTSTESEAKTGAEATKADKTSKKSSTETKSSFATPLPDALEAIVSLDVTWFFTLAYILECVRDSYIATGDTLTKNKLKLSKPKGDGSSNMNMF